MILSQIEPYLDEYLASEFRLFLAPEIKEHAEPLLRAFFQKAKERGAKSLENVSAATVEAVLLQDLGRLNLPNASKQKIPDLLEGFFHFLKTTGRYPAAENWNHYLEVVKVRYIQSLRSDGTQRGETFKKKYTDVGRNDPCPCGSGQKFKKCCGPLIGI